MLVILKIPVAYVGWVVWWAIKAEPEVGTQGGTEGLNWKPWGSPSTSRTRRGGPHGPPPHGVQRGAARAGRKRARIGG